MKLAAAAFVAVFAGPAVAWQGASPAQDPKAPASTPPAPSAPAKPADAAPVSPGAKPDAKPTTTPDAAPLPKPDPYVLNYTMKLIDGQTDKNLKDYEGKVVLIVNVASKCGYTAQYKGLEALHQEYKDRGLVVLGFPANNFGGQEPGTNAEILQFCSDRFNVTFPMFAKTSVTGSDASPLFKQLAKLDGGKEPSWNFNKYLVGKDGKFIAHYESRVKPDDETFVKAIREALGIKPDAVGEGAARPDPRQTPGVTPAPSQRK